MHVQGGCFANINLSIFCVLVVVAVVLARIFATIAT